MIISARAGLAIILLSFVGLQWYLLETPYLLSDEALFAWNTTLLRADPTRIFDSEMWQNHPPLISLLASILPFSALTSLRIISLVSSLIVLMLTFWLGQKFVSKKAGLFAAALLPLTLPFINYSHYGLLDMPLLAGLMLVLFSLVQVIEKNKWELFFIILSACIFIKTRASLIIVPVLTGFFVLYFLHVKKISILPEKTAWHYRNGLFLTGFFAGLIALYLVWRPETVSLVSWSLIARTFFNMVPIPVWVLVVMSFWPRNRKHVISWFDNFSLFWIAWTGMMIFLISFYGDSERFFLIGLPILCIRAGIGFALITQWLSNFFPVRLSIGAVIIVLFVPMLAGAIIQQEYFAEDSGHSAVAEWVRSADGVVYTGFSRELRYWSNVPLFPDGNLRLYPSSAEQMQTQLDETPGNVYVIVGTYLNPFNGEFITREWLEKNEFIEYMRIPGENFEWIIYSRPSKT